MNFMRQIALGYNLTKLTNFVEEMERRERMLPIGINGIDCWSGEARERIVTDINGRTDRLSKVPGHLVTEALGRNMILALRQGREGRARAVSRLLDMLVDGGLAMPLDEFQRCYP